MVVDMVQMLKTMTLLVLMEVVVEEVPLLVMLVVLVRKEAMAGLEVQVEFLPPAVAVQEAMEPRVQEQVQPQEE